MIENRRILSLSRFRSQAHINESQYREMYSYSLQDPAGFWALQAEK